ncbi:hypothetical protein MNBD_UNCLBAC01-1671 [hydrothermal vent metagenome]|uniref:Thioredoxin domain-containing protein n=1 Tax=hydrothermal vent metagenome TaxID=652676 RepID=A0A3B1E516_9ZZZZ
MEKRIFMIVLVVALGVLVGVKIVSKQAKAPILQTLIEQQSKILESQKHVQQMMQRDSGEDNGGSMSEILQRQKNLEGRIAVLEQKLKGQVAPSAPVRQAPPAEDFSKKHDIPVDHSPVYGNKNAPVTIVEFVDFQCPFCARFHKPMAKAIQEYPNKVNYMIKNFPLGFHAQAKPAAKAAFAAGEQGKYWEMAEALLKNGSVLNDEKFEEIARDIGLDVKKFQKDYKEKDAQWEEYITKDMSLGSKVGVRGTPTFYINGRKTTARDVASWKQAIEASLKEKN